MSPKGDFNVLPNRPLREPEIETLRNHSQTDDVRIIESYTIIPIQQTQVTAILLVVDGRRHLFEFDFDLNRWAHTLEPDTPDQTSEKADPSRGDSS